MHLRAVLFDWFGTLVRQAGGAGPSPAEAVARVARERYRLDVTSAAMGRAILSVAAPVGRAGPLGLEPLLAAALDWLGLTVRPGARRALTDAYFAAATAGLAAFADAPPALAALRTQGLRTAVVSNSILPARMLAGLAANLGFAGLLDAVVTAGDEGAAKPHPAIFRAAAAAAGAELHETLFVGSDLAVDVSGARAAGLRAVHLQRQAPAYEAAGYLVIERLGDLPALLA